MQLGPVQKLNTPTLGPVESAKRFQPTLAPKVSPTPVNKPVLTGVTNKPVQQPRIEQVVNKPVGQQETLAIKYAPIVEAITEAQKRGASADLILQKIIEGNPDKAEVFQTALSRGATPEEVLNEIIRQNFTPDIPYDAEEEGAKGLKGFAVGFAKGAGKTLDTISGFGQRAIQKITGDDAPVATIDEGRLTPRGTAEKIGFGTERIAEFFIPGGVISKGGKVIEGSKLISKLPKAVQGATKLTGRAALEATGAAGVTAAQGGDESDIKTAAALGAGFPVVGKVVEKIFRSVPETAWTSILKRTPADAAKNPNLPKEAAQTGLTGFTRQGIANKADRAIQAIEVSLDDLLSKSNGKINSAKVVGYLSDLRTAYSNIPGEQASVKVIDDIAGQMLDGFKRGKPLTVAAANQLKRDIYSVIAKSYGKGALEIPAKTEAQKIIAAALKREIEKVIPEVKSLNQRQAVYIQIKKALDKTIARGEGKGIAGSGISMYDLLVGGIGTGAGLASGNPLLGLGLVAAKKTAESPFVLSATAKLLNYFNQLSPTKKLLFYEAMKGLTVKAGTSINGSARKSE